MNVDFDLRGAVRCRDGYDNFTTSAAADRYHALAPFYGAGTQLLGIRGTTAQVLSTAGASVSTQAITGSLGAGASNIVQRGLPAGHYAYFPDSTNNRLYRWSGSAWAAVSVVAATVPVLLGISPTDNRLAYWDVGSESRLRFSGPGTETWGTNDYVDLTPGDGEDITAIVTWQDSMFVFKETKFFVFYGNTTGSDGVTDFNYRPMFGVGCLGAHAVTTSPEGVYFCARDGVYFTTGDQPRRISDRIEPVFTGKTQSFLQTTAALDPAGANLQTTLHYLDGRLFLSYISEGGDTATQDTTLVYNIQTDQWTLWSLGAAAFTSFRITGREELVFAYAAGANHVGRMNSSYTTDDGTAIVSRYRTGFTDFGNDLEKRIVKTRLFGTGTVNVQWSRDFEALGTAKTATLGTSPAIDQAVVDSNVKKGRLHSWQIGASSGAWTVHRLHHELDPPDVPDTTTP